MDMCFFSLVDVLLLDSAGETVGLSLVHSHSAADSIEVIRTFGTVCRFSCDLVSLTVQPNHLRLWIPAVRFAFKEDFIFDFGYLHDYRRNRTYRVK